MNKTLVIAMVLLALLSAGGLGAFLVLSNRSQTPSTITQQEGSTEGKSIKDLLTMQGSQECSFSDEAGNSGMVYTANGKMRGDFTSAGPQGSINSHMVTDAQTARLWKDGQAQGFMMNITGLTDSATNQQGQVDINKAINFDCNAWSADNSKFVIPTNIEFTDLSSFAATVSSTPEAGSSGTPVMDTKSLQCAACNSLPADSQAPCKAALGCN